MPGFERNRFVDLTESVAKHFRCCICLKILNNAIISECQHSFCKDCVRNLIESNNQNSCPECSHAFNTRKRTNNERSDPHLVIIGNFTFNRNLNINNCVNDFKIKCDFEYNGCQEVLELGQLFDHIRVCSHRSCQICGKISNDKKHTISCIKRLKTKNIELEEKVIELEAEVNSCKETRIANKNKIREQKTKISTLEAVVNAYQIDKKKTENTNKELEESVTKLREVKEKVVALRVEEINENIQKVKVLKQKISNLKEYQQMSRHLMETTKQCLPIVLNESYIQFGKFGATVRNVILRSDSILLTNVLNIELNATKTVNIEIPFNTIEELKGCVETIRPIIAIKLDLIGRISVNQVVNAINVDNDRDPINDTNQYIAIKVVSQSNHEIKHFITGFVNYCKYEPNIKCQVLDAKETIDFIQTLDLQIDKMKNLLALTE